MVAAAAVLNHEASTEGEVVVQNSIGANVRALLKLQFSVLKHSKSKMIKWIKYRSYQYYRTVSTAGVASGTRNTEAARNRNIGLHSDPFVTTDR